jgi:hypothetical protein
LRVVTLTNPDITAAVNLGSLLTLAGMLIGLRKIHLDYEVEIAPGTLWVADWNSFVKTSGNPLEPTLEQIMSEDLTSDEADRLTSHLRPLVENKRRINRLAVSYLWAVKN